MADIDKIIEQLLGDRRISEGTAFSSRTYSDQPLIERGSSLRDRMQRRKNEQAARHEHEARERAKRRSAQAEVRRNSQRLADWFVSFDFDLEPRGSAQHDPSSAHATPLPEEIRRMRELEGAGLPSSLAYGSRTAAALFYEQARLMENYEDDYAFHGGFSQYYPTYATMSDHQLRGYFSWRTRVRHGQVEAAPLSFAFVYVYELLCGVGTKPGAAGLDALRDFGIAYRDADEASGARLARYLRDWTRDYAIYHELVSELGSEGEGRNAAVLTLLKAEHAQLDQTGSAPKIPNAMVTGATPSPDEIFSALSVAGSYHLCDTRMAKAEPQLMRDAACDVFAALVTHCSKRRKTDYVEGLFGYAQSNPYTMFAAAVFYDPKPHPDCQVRASSTEAFTCVDGRWRRTLACDVRSSSSELGLAMHAADFELRRQLDFPYPLKERKVPKYLAKIARDAVAARIQERREAEARRITIDRSKLGGIRAAAAITQEALLTEEERDEVAAAPGAPVPTIEMPMQDIEPAPQPAPAAAQPSLEATPTQEVANTTEGLLDPLGARVLAGLLAGTPLSELLSPSDPFASVVIDTINEQLFDVVGDTVIDFDGSDANLVEDYLDDIREVLNP